MLSVVFVLPRSLNNDMEGGCQLGRTPQNLITHENLKHFLARHVTGDAAEQLIRVSQSILLKQKLFSTRFHFLAGVPLNQMKANTMKAGCQISNV